MKLWIGGEWVDAEGGGAASRSQVGRVGGPFSMDRLTELKTIVLDLG